MINDKHVPNEYKVSKKQWKRWTVVARHVFNKTYYLMTTRFDLFMHPKAIARGIVLTDEEIKTTAWNASWTAADICTRGEKILLKNIEGEVTDGKTHSYKDIY